MGAYKTTASKQIHLAGDPAFAWHRSFPDHIIRDARGYQNILVYIRANRRSGRQINSIVASILLFLLRKICFLCLNEPSALNFLLSLLMLIQYCSDLHLEFTTNRRWLTENPILPEGDILIIAGDTYYLGKDFGHLPFWKEVSKNFRETYVLPGNHEYYGGYNVATSLLETKEVIRKNVWLVNNCVIEEPDVRLIFTTLWSRIEQYKADILLGMNDFRHIRYEDKTIGIEHYNQVHAAAMDFLTGTIHPVPDKRQLVISHHLPSERCNVPEFQGSALNEAFCVDLTDYIQSTPIDAWIYGHSHRNMPEFEIGGTRMLTNQLGYVHLGEDRSFRPNATIFVE